MTSTASRPVPAARRSRRAFTLLELIVVIVVLGLLAALAIPTFQGNVDRSTVETDRLSLAALAREAGALVAFDVDVVTRTHVADALDDCDACLLDAAAPGSFAADGDRWQLIGFDPDGTGPEPVVVDPNLPDPAASERDGVRSFTYGYVNGTGWDSTEVRLVMQTRVDGYWAHAVIRGYGNDIDSWVDQDPDPDADEPTGSSTTTTSPTTTIPDDDRPLEPMDPDVLLPVDWQPVTDGGSPITEIRVPDEHAPELETSLDSGTIVTDTAPTGGFAGISSFVSTDAGFPHRALVTHAGSGTVYQIRQTGPAMDDVVVTEFATGLPDAKAITVGADVSPSTDGGLVLWPVLVGTSADGGSVVEIDPVTRTKTTIASNLGGTPAAFTGYACIAPGATTPTAGNCLYAAVGAQIIQIDLATGTHQVWATTTGAALTGLQTANGPAMLAATATGAVSIATADAAGATPVAGTPVTNASGGLTWIGTNSAAANQGVWAGTTGGFAKAGEARTAGDADFVASHYHGQPDWLYGATTDAVYVTDLGSGTQTRLWPVPLGEQSITWAGANFGWSSTYARNEDGSWKYDAGGNAYQEYADNLPNEGAGPVWFSVVYADAPLDMGEPLAGSLTGKRISKLTSYYRTFIALADDGTLHTWGDGLGGYLRGDYAYPTHIPYPLTRGSLAGKTFVDVRTGDGNYALDTAGILHGWDNGESGGPHYLGTPGSMNFGSLAGKQVKAFDATNADMVIAVATDNTVHLMGDISAGGPESEQAFYANTPHPGAGNTWTPTQLDLGPQLAGADIVRVEIDQDTAAVLTADGQVWTWGWNRRGAVGDPVGGMDPGGWSIPVTNPVQVTAGSMAGKTIDDIAVGQWGMYALATDGTLHGWGYNAGYLGIGTTTAYQYTPVEISTFGSLAGKTVSAIHTDGWTSHVVAADGTVHGWGLNRSSAGLVGNGNRTVKPSAPVQLTGVSGPLADVTVGNDTTIFVGR